MKFLNTKGNLDIIERDDYEERNIVLDESLFDLRMSELNSHLVNNFMRYIKNSNERPILFVITAPGTEEDIEDMFEMYVIGLLQVIVNNQKPKKERRWAARAKIRESLNLNQMNINELLNFESNCENFNIIIQNEKGQAYFKMLE